MPGLQSYPFWEGNRSELLAIYVLSSVASVVPVPHQFDFGFDLLCTLTRLERDVLFAERAFAVQVKSSGTKSVPYGGRDKKGGWKGYKIDWLYGQDQPHLLVLVNLSEWRVRIYSTFRIWWLKWQIENPGRVVLLPDVDLEEFGGRSLNNRYKSRFLPRLRNGGGAAGDGRSYRVPLGPPIADVTLRGNSGEPYRETLRRALNSWVDLDYENIRHFRSLVPFVIEAQNWDTNAPVPAERKIWHFSNPKQDKNVVELLGAVGPAVTSLMLNLRRQGQSEKVEKLLGIAELAREYGELDPIGLKLLRELTKKMPRGRRGC